MAKNLHKQVTKAVEKVEQWRTVAAQKRATVKAFFKKSAYWSAIFVIGMGITGTILHIGGVPIIEVANAQGSVNWLTLLVGNFLYYVFIGPIGAAAAIVGVVLEVVINYPHGLIFDGDTGGFVNVSAVKTGWKLVRDVCNVFFSLILVIIAIATVLKIEAYNWKQLLPKFILMAVLINFSKSIAGVFTDLATVIMATFGGSFAGSFASGIIGAFGLPTLGDIAPGTEDEGISAAGGTSFTSLMLAYVAAAAMIMVFFVVMVVFTVTLIFRIIMLWFLIVLSPLAYITRILPQTQKYSSEWWDMFGRYTLVGPLVTFFLWLSLSIAFGTEQDIGNNEGCTSANPLGMSINYEDCDGVTSTQQLPASPESEYQHTTPNAMANFLIALMMLMASLRLINRMATEVGGMLKVVEAAAWGAGASLMTMPGRLMQSASGGIGEVSYETETGADGKPVEKMVGPWYAKASRGWLGKVGAVLGSTVFDPVTSVKKAYTDLGLSQEAKAKRSRQIARKQVDQLRESEIAGRGGIGFVKGIIANVSGVVAGTGLNGKHVFDQYLSLGGLLRAAQEFKNYKAGLTPRAEGLKAKYDEEKKQLKEDKQNIQLTAREAAKAESEHATLVETIQAAQDAAAGIDTNEMRLDDIAVQTAIDAQIEMLTGDLATAAPGDKDAINQQITQLSNLRNFGSKRDELQKQITDAKDKGDTAKATRLNNELNDLRSLTANGGLDGAGDKEVAGTITLAALQNRIGKPPTTDEETARKDDIKQQLVDQYGNNVKENVLRRDALAKKLQTTGYELEDPNNPNAKVRKGATMHYDTKETRAARKEEFAKRETEQKKRMSEYHSLINKVAAASPGLDYDSRLEDKKLLSEELQKLQGVENTPELMTYLTRAIREKNRHLAEAAYLRIVQQGDGNELPQSFMAFDLDTGALDPNARSDAVGIENLRKKMLKGKLGMSDQDSMRMLSDAAFMQERMGHLGGARQYGVEGGKMRMLGEEERIDLLVGEKLKLDISELTRMNRLGFGYEDNQRNFHLDDVGLRILLANGDEFSDPRRWTHFNANAKLNLSKPEVMKILEQKGVSYKLLSKLKEFGEMQGERYQQGTDLWREDLAARTGR